MEVVEIKERGDGSCDLDITLTQEEVQILLNFAINEILRRQIERM